MTQKSKGLKSIRKHNSDFHFHTDRQGSNGPHLQGPRNKMTNNPTFPPTSTATMFPNSSSPSTTLAPGENCPMDDSSLQIPLALSYGLLFVLGLVGNTLALWVFLCVHAKKNSVRVFLINTALADLLLVGCLPFRVLYHSRGNCWQLGSFMCSVVGNLFYMNMYISITLLGLISMDRYLKIKRSVALQSRLRATRWSTAICTAIWIVFSVVVLAFLVSNKNEDQQKCFQYKSLHMDKWKAYINFTVVGGFWLIFVALVVSYGKIGMHLLGTSRANPALPNASRYARTAKKSFFVLFLFTVCFVPYHVLRLFYITSQITSTSCAWQAVVDRANEVSLLFSTLNSCLDPVMYFLLSSSVRRETLRLVGAVLRMRGRGVGVSGSSSSAEQGVGVGRTVRAHSADS